MAKKDPSILNKRERAILDYIEKQGKGLNLTYAVKNGIACHTNQVSCTREGNVVRLSDKIAYINHDIEDSIRANILKPEELPFDCISVLGDTKSKRITTLIASIIKIVKDTKDPNATKVSILGDNLINFLNPLVK